jgi:hypothetical protein
MGTFERVIMGNQIVSSVMTQLPIAPMRVATHRKLVNVAWRHATWQWVLINFKGHGFVTFSFKPVEFEGFKILFPRIRGNKTVWQVAKEAVSKVNLIVILSLSKY